MATDVLVVLVVLVIMLVLDMVTVYFHGWLWATISSLIGFVFGSSLLVGSGSPNNCVFATSANITSSPCIILNTYVNQNGALLYDLTSPVIFVLIVGMFTLASIIMIFKYGRTGL